MSLVDGTSLSNRISYLRYLNQKIRACNIIALMEGSIALCFAVFSYFFYPDLLLYPLLALGIVGVVLLLNKYHIHQLSRSMLAILFPMLDCLYHALLVEKGAPILLGLYAICFAFAFQPFLLFDQREKPFLYLLAGINFTLILAYQQIAYWWDPAGLVLDESLFHIPFIAFASELMACLLTFGCLLVLIKSIYQKEKLNAKILAQQQQNYLRLIASENQLKVNLKELNEARQQENHRNWSSEGMTLFANLLHEIEDFGALAPELLKQIVSYLEANQGALYIVEHTEELPQLQPVASYAYNRHKRITKPFYAGEGLLGQAYLEKEVVYLTDVPQDYINITSGLGHALPRAVIIVPCIINQEVTGVFELASFQEFSAHQIDFLKSLSEMIAQRIQANLIRERTQNLLEQSQKQAEKLQEQEASLRETIELYEASQKQQAREQQTMDETGLILRSIIDHAEHTYIVIDRQLTIRLINKTLAEKYMKLGIDLKVGSNILHTLPEHIRQGWKAKYERGLAGETLSFTTSQKTAEETTISEVQIQPIRNKNSEVIAICVSSVILNPYYEKYQALQPKAG